MKYMGLEIDPASLITMQEALARLENGRANYKALSELRDEQTESTDGELVWHYPISDGDSLGAYIIPVREGFLWVPYDEVGRADGEILSLHDARLLELDDCQILANDWKSYADALHSALLDMANACADPDENLAQASDGSSTVFFVVDFNTTENLIEIDPYAKRDDAVAHWRRLYEQAVNDRDIIEITEPDSYFRAWFASDRSNYYECSIVEKELRQNC